MRRGIHAVKAKVRLHIRNRDLRRSGLYLALVLTLLFAVFSHGFRNTYTSLDDDGLIFFNPIQREFGFPQLRDAFDPRAPRSGFGAQFTPMSDLSYAVDRQLFGDVPQPYHWQGTVFHALATAALFVLLRRLGASAECALVAAALFALHPLQVEPVTWIAGRRTAMAGAFMLWSMLAWYRARTSGSKAAYVASIVLALLANLSKQSAVITCLLLAATEWAAYRVQPDRVRPEVILWRTAGRRLPAYLPHIVMSLVFIGIGIWVGWREEVIEPQPMDAPNRLRLAAVAIQHYAASVVWPVNLRPAYRVVVPGSWTDPRVMDGLMLAGGGALAAWFCARPAPLAAFGLLVATIAILPGAHGIGSQLVADRYAYVTMAGIAIVVATAIVGAGRRAPRAAALAALCLTAALAVSSYARIEAWRDDVTISRDASLKDPDDPLWHRQLGKALVRAGSVEEGERELRRAAALSLQPLFRGRSTFPLIVLELGLLRAMRGDDTEAEAWMELAFTEAGPDQIDTVAAVLAEFYLVRNEPEFAIGACTKSLDVAPARAVRCRKLLERIRAASG